jgi:hypothetical protein
MKLKSLNNVSILVVAICSQIQAPALAGEPIDLNRFPVGTWINITPPLIVTGGPETCIGQGLALDFRNPGTIYWTNAPYETSGDGNGLFKSKDYGVTWRRIASVKPAYPGASNYLDMPLHVRIDPNDSNHLYVGDGVRGSSQGFFVSHDGGETFVKPPGFVAATTAAGIDNHDVYDVAVDPTNFEHVLVTFHYRWGWDDTKWNKNSGLMESNDGGASWKVISPVGSWGSGHSIKFLFESALDIGNSRIWLLGTQADGIWRTTDGGEHWTKVSAINITHGGSALYYTRGGVLYSGGEQTIRSTDNGVTWTPVLQRSTWAVYGDGTLLYTGGSFGANAPTQVTPESNGTAWTDFNNQRFQDGPYEMAFESKNGLMFSSNWSSGIWVLRPR